MFKTIHVQTENSRFFEIESNNTYAQIVYVPFYTYSTQKMPVIMPPDPFVDGGLVRLMR